MDRKSFFKRALLALGAAVVPNAILRAAKGREPTEFLKNVIRSLKPVKAEDYFWYEGKPYKQVVVEGVPGEQYTIRNGEIHWSVDAIGPYEEKIDGVKIRKYKKTVGDLKELYKSIPDHQKEIACSAFEEKIVYCEKKIQELESKWK